jgi:cytochrome P450
MPRFQSRRTRGTARAVRALVADLTRARAGEIAAGTAPDDLATKIMTTPDPLTGERLGWREMVDQVAIFFLAGHETSASALAWTLWLLAAHPAWQERAAEEARELSPGPRRRGRLRACRDSFREALRLYPPVPMMVREASRAEAFRGRTLGRGTQVVVSPWHLGRHERIWSNPDGFDPGRWATEEGRACGRDAFIPFSRGAARVPRRGLRHAGGSAAPALLLRRFRFEVLGRPGTGAGGAPHGARSRRRVAQGDGARCGGTSWSLTRCPASQPPSAEPATPRPTSVSVSTSG